MPPPTLNLDAWCQQYLGSVPIATLFRQTHLSTVTAYRLADGREVVIKARSASARLYACLDVQLQLWRLGFPCPQPLTDLTPHEGQLLSAESYVGGGTQVDGTAANALLFAAPLAEQVRLCLGYIPATNLEPAPPWLGGWSHPGSGLWPLPDDLDVDLNARANTWLDDIARRVAALLGATDLTPVIGHADWHPGNLRWHEGQLLVAYDWDSLARLPEAAIAGGASVIFTLSARASASLDASRAFFDAYAEARGYPWNDTERHLFWAAGLWNLAFDAKKQSIDGEGESLQRLEAEADARLALAAL